MFKKILLISVALLIVVGWALGLCWLSKESIEQAQADIEIANNVSGWAWSANIGWISFNCSSDSTCGTSDYGVRISKGGLLSGQAWSDNVGWVSFDKTYTGTPPEAPFNSGEEYIAKVDNPAQIGESEVKIEGWARVLSACDSLPCSSSGPCADCGDWDGWIKFVDVTIDAAGEFHGYAWGSSKDIDSEVIGTEGWISFNCEEGGPTKNDVCGSSDYVVEVDPDAVDCDCVWIDDDCAKAGCETYQMHQVLSCNPVGCMTGDRCQDEPSCDCDCLVPITVGECGVGVDSNGPCPLDNRLYSCANSCCPAGCFEDSCQHDSDCDCGDGELDSGEECEVDADCPEASDECIDCVCVSIDEGDKWNWWEDIPWF